MVLNWTIEVLIYFITAGICGVGTINAALIYTKRHERHVLWLTVAFLSATILILEQGFSFLYLFLPLFAISGLNGIIFGYMLLFAVDSISHEAIDSLKISLWTGISVAVVILASSPDSFSESIFPNGDKSLATAGAYQYVAISYILFPILVYVYYVIKIHRQAPLSLKRSSRLFLIGLIILLVLNVILVASRLTLLIPGVVMIPFSVAMLFLSFVFLRQPKLAFILPFKVQRLTVIETEGGRSLYTHSWKSGQGLIDEDLFSGMLQGISLIVKESLNRGNVREIALDEGVIILQRHKASDIASVLVANKSSRSLRNALYLFTDKFYARFQNELARLSDINQFTDASALVQETFGFIPE